MKDMYLFTRNFAGFRKGEKVATLEKPIADELERKNIVEKVEDVKPEKEVEKSEKPKKDKKK